MDTPDTSGAESPALQAIIKAGHGVLGQLRQRDIPDSRGDMTVNQIAVSAHCSAAPSALILTKPPVTPLTHGKIVLTVHGFYLLFANATIPQKERNSYCFPNIFFHIPIRGCCLQSGQWKPSGPLCISPDSLLLFRAVSSCLKRRLAVPLHGNFTPPRFSPSCPHCLSLWLGRSIIVPRWNLRKTVCRRPLSGPMESLMPVCFYRRLSSRIVRCRLPQGQEPHPGMYFSNW